MKIKILSLLALTVLAQASIAREPEAFIQASFHFGGAKPAPMTTSLGFRQWNEPLDEFINFTTFSANAEQGLSINFMDMPVLSRPMVLTAGEEGSIGGWISSVSTTALVVGGVVAVAAIASAGGGDSNSSGSGGGSSSSVPATSGNECNAGNTNVVSGEDGSSDVTVVEGECF